MSNLIPFTSGTGGLLPRDARTTGRGLSHLRGQSALDVARVDAVAELQAVKVEAVAQVAGRALQATALAAQLEQQLSQAVPLAAGRLQAIGDMAALQTIDIVADTAWKLKRC